LKVLREALSNEAIVQLVIRLGLLAGLIYWSFVLIRPFVPILVWSAVLGVALYPVFGWFAKILGGRPKLAATILTVVSLGIVIGPATWLGLSAVEGMTEFAGQLSAGTIVVPSAPVRIKDWPLFGSQLFDVWDYVSTHLREALREVAPYLKPVATTMLGLAGDAGVGTLKFLFSVALMGFLFIYGPQFVTAMRGFLSRVAPEQSEHFLELAGATIRAVSQGIIGIAIVQSLLAGIVFKLAGVPLAGLLAFAILLLSIVQIGGAIIVFPVIIWVWATKAFVTALLITVILIIVGLLDNILKPLVMGRGLTTPTLVILVGVIGGTLAHGIVGLFIGPIILSVVWELAAAWVNQDRVPVTPSVEQ
jgi:predicted PurR-regulated permease PerM